MTLLQDLLQRLSHYIIARFREVIPSTEVVECAGESDTLVN